MRSDFFSLRGCDGAAHVFALDERGAVRHLEVSSLGKKARASDWDNFGGEFSGSVSAVGEGDDGFHIFVSDPERGIFARRWYPRDANGSERDWELLAGFIGPVATEMAEDGSVILVGFTDGTAAVYKRSARRKGWDGKGWRVVEGADEAPHPGMERPRAKGKRQPANFGAE